MSENKKMSDEERLALAAKLDKELDEFINGLEKKRYTEGWPEDRWQEEMDKHPFFMKKHPEPGDEVHPLFEGMQQLKYDADENTADELALNYKEDGNFYMKHKKFRMSVLSFTEGLKSKSDNIETNAILYNNRSAAHFFLKNYRSSLTDAVKALELKPDYHKAKWRAAQCSFFLNRFEVCVKYCEEILEHDAENQQAKQLYEQCRNKKLESEVAERKHNFAERKKKNELNRLIGEIRKRQIKFDDLREKCDINEELLKPKLLPLENHPVTATPDGMLIWPAAFSYPEFLFSDFQQQLSEDVVLEDCINEMFAVQLECDKKHIYQPGKLSVFYENRKAGTVHKIKLRKTIRDILQEKNFYVSGGALLFYVVPDGSRIEEEFINQVRRPMVYS